MTAASPILPFTLGLPSGGHPRPALGSRTDLTPGRPLFFIGLHQPSDAWPFAFCMVNVQRIWKRKSGFRVNRWLMDSGAFQEISKHGGWRSSPDEYVERIEKYRDNGELLAAVSQDMMCEAFVLKKTGLTVGHHQDITIDRYQRISSQTTAPVMPVLQGYEPREYVECARKYGSLLKSGAWCGVGSVCQRNDDPSAIADVLDAIHTERPDLLLHGFGLKIEALRFPAIRQRLVSSDSMAWCRAESFDGRDANDPRAALRYVAKVQDAIGVNSFIQPRLYDLWK